MSAQQPLATDFWLSAHDRPDGLPLLSDFTLGVGLGTALLAELLQHVTVPRTEQSPTDQQGPLVRLMALRDGQLFLNPTASWDVDDTLYEVLYLLYEETQHLPRHGYNGVPVGDIIRYLAGSGPGRARELLEGPMRGRDYAPPRRVHQRTITRGRLTRRDPPLAEPRMARRGLRRAITHVPRSTNDAGTPGMRVTMALRSRTRLDLHFIVLGALYRVTGLTEAFFSVTSEDMQWLGQNITQLPAELQELLNHAELLMGDNVMR